MSEDLIAKIRGMDEFRLLRFFESFGRDVVISLDLDREQLLAHVPAGVANDPKLAGVLNADLPAEKAREALDQDDAVTVARSTLEAMARHPGFAEALDAALVNFQDNELPAQVIVAVGFAISMIIVAATTEVQISFEDGKVHGVVRKESLGAELSDGVTSKLGVASSKVSALGAGSGGQVRVIVFTANASIGGAHLRLEEEMGTIRAALKRAPQRSRFDVRMVPAATFATVVAEIDDYAPDIVHFAGHGSDDGEIMFLAQANDPGLVSSERMLDLLGAVCYRPKLIVFSMCNSGEVAEVVVSKIDYAIGFDGEIEGSAIRIFIAMLYERLASRIDMDVPRAFELARVAADNGGGVGVELARLSRNPAMSKLKRLQ